MADRQLHRPPVVLPHISICLLLLLASLHAVVGQLVHPGVVGQLVHPDDCGVLLGWPAFADKFSLTSCEPRPACSSFSSNPNGTVTSHLTCDPDGRVTSINLVQQNLGGQLPEGLNRLPLLSSLRLSKNQLTGSLPGSWDNMTTLDNLWLDLNPHLQGAVPSYWLKRRWSSFHMGHTATCGPLPTATNTDPPSDRPASCSTGLTPPALSVDVRRLLQYRSNVSYNVTVTNLTGSLYNLSTNSTSPPSPPYILYPGIPSSAKKEKEGGNAGLVGGIVGGVVGLLVLAAVIWYIVTKKVNCSGATAGGRSEFNAV